MKKEKEERYNYAKWYVDLFKDELPRETEKSAYLGLLAETNYKVYINIDEFVKTTIISGATGNGKTVAGQVIAEELLLKGIPVIVIDPTNQWTGFRNILANEKMLNRYLKFGLAKPRNFNVDIITSEQIENFNIKKAIAKNKFTVFAAKELTPRELDSLILNITKSLLNMELPKSNEIKLLLVIEEAHRALARYGSPENGFSKLIASLKKLSELGIGTVFISQLLSDFREDITSIKNHIQMKTSYDSDLKMIEEKFGKDRRKSLEKAEIGVGLFCNSNFNNGYSTFVEFRPLFHDILGLKYFQ